MPRKKARTPSPPQTRDRDANRVEPSSPKVPPRFCLHLRYPYDAPIGEGRKMTQTFVGAHAARKFVEHAIGDDSFEWPNLHTIHTASKLEITCLPPTNRMVENDLEKALNHEYTSEQEEWELPEKYKKQLEMFTRPWSKTDMQAQPSHKTSRASVAPKPYGELISVTDICTEIGIKPRDGRAALRKSNIKKPAHGWSFLKDSPELQEVTKFLKGVK